MNCMKLLKPLSSPNIGIQKQLLDSFTPGAFAKRLVSVSQHSQSTKSSAVAEGDDNYQLVYTGSLSKRVLRVKMLSVGGSVASLAVLPQIVKPVVQSSVPATLALIGGSSFFIIGTPLVLHWMCKRYVTELRFNAVKKRFRATVRTLFFRKRHIDFTADEVEVPGTPLLLTSFLVRGYPLLLNAEDFDDIDVYKHMMGYDKPMDFLLKGDKPKSS